MLVSGLVKQMVLAWEASAPNASVFGFPSSNDTLIAGPGNQYLNGQGGADTYVYASADGNDTIDDGGSSSRMVFSDINAADVTLSKVSGNSNLVITDSITGHTVTVLGQFSNGAGTLQSFTFADGTVWTAAQANAMAWYRGTSGNDTLGGSGANDTFASSAGVDTLNGNGGFDSYEFSPTFGQTTINNLASDGVTGPRGEIDFGTGIASNRLWFLQSGNNLQIDVLGTNEQVTVAGWFGTNARAGADDHGGRHAQTRHRRRATRLGDGDLFGQQSRLQSHRGHTNAQGRNPAKCGRSSVAPLISMQ